MNTTRDTDPAGIRRQLEGWHGYLGQVQARLERRMHATRRSLRVELARLQRIERERRRLAERVRRAARGPQAERPETRRHLRDELRNELAAFRRRAGATYEAYPG